MITQDKARELLARYRAAAARRDAIIVAAYKAGISKHEISRLSGVARATVDRVMARAT